MLGHLGCQQWNLRSNMWRECIIRVAESFIGTPFHLNSERLGVGIDCGRFPHAVYSQVGIVVPDLPSHWPRDFMCNAMADSEPYLAIIRQAFNEVVSAQPGDLAVFKPLRSRCFSHAAIVVEWPIVIHARGVGSAPKVERGYANQWPLAGSPVLFFSPKVAR